MKDDRRWTVSLAAALMLLVTAQFAPARAQTFDPPADYPLAGESPGRTATGDLNGDGYPDIAVPTQVPGFDGYVEVLLNLGDGTFGAPAQYGVGRTPRSVAVADFGGDGDLDLAVANHDDGTVSVLMNRGDGTFDPAVDRTAGSWPFVVVAGDLDGDGFADLAVANTYEVSTLGNNGDGTFDDPRGSPFTDEIVALAIGEMEGDADLDLIVLAKRESGSWPNYDREAWVTQLLNDGSGSLNPGSEDLAGSWGYSDDWYYQPSVDSLALGDLDGNGYLDVLVGATVGLRSLPETGPRGTFNVMLNSGGVLSWGTPAASGLYNTQLATGDLDNDGDQDVATASEYLLNNGDATFGVRQYHGGAGQTVTVDDLNADDMLDLVLTTGSDVVRVKLQVDLCPGDPNKTEPGACGCGSPETDSDGDGVPDCIDQCPGEPDVDSDGDGALDCVDGCPDDPDKTDPGTCGCGYADDDSDGDGVADCVDSCPRQDDTVDCNGNFIPDGCDVGGGWMVGGQTLSGSGGDNEYFGQAVSVHGDVIVVSANGSGSTYVYRNWAFEQTLPGPVSWGGWDVDVHGDVIAIGGGGPVRLFRYNAGAQEWQPEQELPSQGQYFGHSVSLHGDTLVVGSERDDDLTDDAGAAYVYHYSGGSWVEQGKLLASDGDAGDHFGTDVSIHGDVLVVGACNTLTSEHGAAYIFRLNGGDWVEEQKLTDTDTIFNSDFGQAVAIAENVAVIGAPSDSELGNYAGAAHTFRFDGNAWVEEQKLTATDGEPGDELGWGGLSVDGNRIVVGAHMDDDRGQDAGSAYMFHFDEGTARWVEHWKLYGTHLAPDEDFYGRAVAVHGDNIVVGSRWSDISGTHSGAAYLYEFATFATDCDFDGVPDDCQPDTDLDGLIDACDDDCDGDGTPDDLQLDTDLDGLIDACDEDDDGDGTADLDDLCPGFDDALDCDGDGTPDDCDPEQGAEPSERKLVAGDPTASAQFGDSVSIDGETAVVGATFDSEAGRNAGAAYVLRYDATTDTWSEQAKLIASDPAAYDNFGDSVSVSGDVVLAGAPYDGDAGASSGSAYVFRRGATSGTWTQEAKLTASDDAAGDRFGYSVSISGDVLAAGAPYDDDGGDNSGSVYVFRYDDTQGVWLEEAKLTAGADSALDYFGMSVSIREDVIAVGAPGDDDVPFNGGAVYVFRYDDSTQSWIQESKLAASDAADGDQFGHSVSIDVSRIVVGSPWDDDAGDASGSAYVFRYGGTPGTWMQEGKLTAGDDSAAYDYFGYSVSISGDRAVIGASGDDDGGDWSGSAYLFRYDEAVPGWIQQHKLAASDPGASEYFGESASISGSKIVIGARMDDDGATDAGSAYAYRLASDCDGDGTADACQPDNDWDGTIDACDLDDDGDVVPDAQDCAPLDATVWSIPGEVRNVALVHDAASDTTTISWVEPTEPGGSAVYDTLRSDLPDGFDAAPTCVESGDGLDTVSEDLSVPTAGALYYYLVRSQNACGTGSLGESSAGSERTGGSCP